MKTIKLVVALIAIKGLVLSASANEAIVVGGPTPITEACLIDAHQGWINGLLAIAEANRTGGDPRAVAKEVIQNGYNYDFAPVLFKPTLTFGEQTFRTTAEGALAYFVGGNPEFAYDEGFALKGWTAVHPRNAAFFIEGNLGITMGHFTFVNESAEEVTVEKTFVFRRGDCGAMRIVLHKSAIPFNPTS
jgi:hypothetical protein